MNKHKVYPSFLCFSVEEFLIVIFTFIILSAFVCLLSVLRQLGAMI